MAYVTPELAVVSLGCSCQPAHQISRFFGGGGQGAVQTTFFDWTITPSIALESLASAGLPVPMTIDDLDFRRGPPLFSAHGMLFYHEMVGGDRYAVTAEGFGLLRARYATRAQSTRLAMSSRRVVFVWANTQNNLPSVADECDGLDLTLTDDVVARVMTAGDRLAGRPAEYLFVTYRERASISAIHARATVEVITPDSSEWGGDDGQWDRMLARVGEAVPA